MTECVSLPSCAPFQIVKDRCAAANAVVEALKGHVWLVVEVKNSARNSSRSYCAICGAPSNTGYA